jgi:hypothetical protein
MGVNARMENLVRHRETCPKKERPRELLIDLLTSLRGDLPERRALRRV